MSRLRKDLITNKEEVLPFLRDLYNNFPKYYTKGRMYLVGSRGRIPIDKWGRLEGKDWDILIETSHLITNTKIWGLDKGYYIEIVCNTEDVIQRMRQNNYKGEGSGMGIELFPNTPEKIKKYL